MDDFLNGKLITQALVWVEARKALKGNDLFYGDLCCGDSMASFQMLTVRTLQVSQCVDSVNAALFKAALFIMPTFLMCGNKRSSFL